MLHGADMLNTDVHAFLDLNDRMSIVSDTNCLLGQNIGQSLILN